MTFVRLKAKTLLQLKNIIQSRAPSVRKCISRVDGFIRSLRVKRQPRYGLLKVYSIFNIEFCIFSVKF